MFVSDRKMSQYILTFLLRSHRSCLLIHRLITLNGLSILSIYLPLVFIWDAILVVSPLDQDLSLVHPEELSWDCLLLQWQDSVFFSCRHWNCQLCSSSQLSSWQKIRYNRSWHRCHLSESLWAYQTRWDDLKQSTSSIICRIVSKLQYVFWSRQCWIWECCQ